MRTNKDQNSIHYQFERIYEKTTQLISKHQNQQDLFAKEIKKSVRVKTENLTFKLNYLEKSLKSVDPTPWLKSGWTKILHDGKNITSIQDIKEGELLHAYLLDGVMTLEIKQKKERKK